ncbi:hypothetical protein [Martelella soudanensis]|uniref:hypothetical protein n=1 Tax=unclassified Martelella TaxID=2629616 RepID=UPI0015DDF735|nr:MULTISPECIES: hypothetical protein [unclassified Martelella]
MKRFDYLVVGDASSIDGLAAPYDEEETDQVVHVERLDAGLDLFEFVNGGVKTGHGAEQKSATLDAGMRPAGGRSPSGGLIPA